MKEFKFDIINEKIYYKKLDNGLDVYFLPKMTSNKYYMTFTTKYGAKHNEFIPFGKEEYLKTPYGVAHFLEHKMFEQEDGTDPFDYFSKLGVDANAYTSLDNTTYLASGSNNFDKCLNYLIDYVQSPYFTKENIEKEQGIIGQEIDMYLDDADSVLDEKLRYNALFNHPNKYSIIGSKNDISNINKDILYDCYHTFYHPQNMFIVITGNFDIDNAIKIIEENQSKKNYKKENDTVYKQVEEEDKVNKIEEKLSMLVSVPKVSYGIKIPTEKFNNMDKKERNFYLDLIFNLLFDETSIYFEELFDTNIIMSPIYTGYIDCDSHIFMEISTTSNVPEKFIEKTKEYLKNIKISEEDIKRRINAYISETIYKFENIDAMAHFIESNIVNYGSVDTNIKKLYKSVTKNEVDKFIKKLDVSNYNYVIIDNKNK